MKILAKNKKIPFSYDILEKFEAGLTLHGHEVKSVKTGHLSLKGSYLSIRNGEAWLINAFIPPYKMAGRLSEYEPLRPRKLLLRKKEINYLTGKLNEKGLTLMPIKVYTKHGKIKLEAGLARGKKKFDKRETIRRREEKRETARTIRSKGM